MRPLPPSPSPVRRPAPAIVVWSVFASISLLVLFYVAHFGVNVPFWDEWDGIVPVYSGNAPCNLAWLWKPHNEHRIFLPRLIQVTLYAATHDVRTTILVNVLALIGATAALLFSLYSARGRWRYCDAALPLLLLPLGAATDLLWAFQTVFFCSAVLCLLYLSVLLRPSPLPRNALSLARIALCAVCTFCLPLCGANGIPFALPFGASLIFLGACQVRRQNADSPDVVAGIVGIVSGIATLVLSAVYFIGLPKIPRTPTTSIQQVLVGLDFGIIGLGKGAFSSFPYTFAVIAASAALVVARLPHQQARMPDRFRRLFLGGAGLVLLVGLVGLFGFQSPLIAATSSALLTAVCQVIMPVLFVVSCLPLVRAFLRGERSPQLIGMLAFLCGCLLTIVGVGHGRAWNGPEAGRHMRYVLLGMLTPCAIYVASQLSPEKPQSAGIPAYLLALATFLLPVNVMVAWDYGAWQYRLRSDFAAHARAGASVARLTAEGKDTIYPDPAALAMWIRQMRDAHLPPFENVPRD